MIDFEADFCRDYPTLKGYAATLIKNKDLVGVVNVDESISEAFVMFSDKCIPYDIKEFNKCIFRAVHNGWTEEITRDAALDAPKRRNPMEDAAAEKICIYCKDDLPLSNFYWSPRKGYSSYCRACNNERAKRLQKPHRERGGSVRLTDSFIIAYMRKSVRYKGRSKEYLLSMPELIEAWRQRVISSRECAQFATDNAITGTKQERCRLINRYHTKRLSDFYIVGLLQDTVGGNKDREYYYERPEIIEAKRAELIYKRSWHYCHRRIGMDGRKLTDADRRKSLKESKQRKYQREKAQLTDAYIINTLVKKSGITRKFLREHPELIAKERELRLAVINKEVKRVPFPRLLTEMSSVA